MGIAPEGFVYVPDFLSPEEQGVLLRQLRELNYKHDIFRGRPLKRRSAQFGYTYVATGRRLDPGPPVLDFLAALVKKGLPYCPEGTCFNQVIVTHYPKTGIGWHTDALHFGECIMAISLGVEEARLQFRPNGSKDASYELQVVPGSLYIMEGPSRWEHQHQVIPVKTSRYSLTFRQVEEPASNRAHITAMI